MLKAYKPGVPLTPLHELPPVETSFLIESRSPKGLYGVFEDEGETGYLYVFDPDTIRILNHVHVYDRTDEVRVGPTDVAVVWSIDASKVGVRVWHRMRAIIDLTKARPAREWLTSRNSPRLDDPEWLEGFGGKE
jgi:hypothetical protein